MDGNAPPSLTNRRQSKRLRLGALVHAFPVGRPKHLIAGRLRDIGLTGLAFETESTVGCGQVLSLAFPIGPTELTGMTVSGVVARSEVETETARFVVGLSFVGLQGVERQRLTSALRHRDVLELLREASKAGASDLHLAADRPPTLRVAGKLRPLGTRLLSGPDLKLMISTLLDLQHLEALGQGSEVNLIVTAGQESRYRGNIHLQQGNLEAAFRRIEPTVQSIDQLRLPTTLRRFTNLPDGLLLISGPTGSGKTTAVSAMVDHINTTREAVVIMLESPIEYVHRSKRSIIKQREVGRDTRSYAIALTEAMRQDPDVLVIGEIRDAETMRTAIVAVTTGHLVICTIPAGDCVSTILRVLQFFPADLQHAVRSQLANCLKGIVSLRLNRSANGSRVVPATEILVGTHSVGNMIRKGTFHQINNVIQTGAVAGMRPFSATVRGLQKGGRVVGTTAAQPN